MIERIMLFKLHDPGSREEVAQQTLAALQDLEQLEELTIGLPADAASERSWDLSIVLAVDNLALLHSVLEGPVFRAYLEQTMKDRYVVLKAWSFERLG
jgi:hypothetical protein